MNRTRSVILVVGVILTAGILANVFVISDGSDVDCERIYNQSVDQGNVENIPDECKPIPDEVENQILIGSIARGR